MIDSIYYKQLSSLFSSTFLKLIAENGHRNRLLSILKRSGYINLIDKNISLINLLDDIYSFLFSNYRSEYIYKNAIVNRILKDRHSIKTSTIISEFRVDRSKADIVLLNGTSCVYEIKTELDSLNRLPSQIDAYKKMFDRIYIVSHEKFIKKIEENIDNNIGIISLSDQSILVEKRPAASNKNKVDPCCIFNSLRLLEYKHIIKGTFGYIPNVPNTMIFNACKKIFCQLEPAIAHDEMVKVLKARNTNKIDNLIKIVPDSLKMFCLNYNLSKAKISYLENILMRPAFR